MQRVYLDQTSGLTIGDRRHLPRTQIERCGAALVWSLCSYGLSSTVARTHEKGAGAPPHSGRSRQPLRSCRLPDLIGLLSGRQLDRPCREDNGPADQVDVVGVDGWKRLGSGLAD